MENNFIKIVIIKITFWNWIIKVLVIASPIETIVSAWKQYNLRTHKYLSNSILQIMDSHLRNAILNLSHRTQYVWYVRVKAVNCLLIIINGIQKILWKIFQKMMKWKEYFQRLKNKVRNLIKKAKKESKNWCIMLDKLVIL